MAWPVFKTATEAPSAAPVGSIPTRSRVLSSAAGGTGRAIRTSSMTTLLVVNPAAGRGRAGRLADAAAAACAAAWGAVERLDTTAPGTAVEQVRRAVEGGVERVVVLGGDGSLHEAANGLLRADVRTRPPITVLPAGTGNDFAKLAGTVGLSPAEAVPRLARGRVRMLDVGYAWDEYFLNSVGIGFDAEVAAEVARGGRLSGIPAYLVAVVRVLRGFVSPTLSCRWDEASFTDRFLLIEIGVGPVVGGGFRITPHARPDDGVFDVCAIRHQSTLGILTKLPLAMFGWHTRLAAVRSFRTASLAISRADGPLRAQMDGELRSLRSDMSITLKPLALPVLVTA